MLDGIDQSNLLPVCVLYMDGEKMRRAPSSSRSRDLWLRPADGGRGLG